MAWPPYAKLRSHVDGWPPTVSEFAEWARGSVPLYELHYCREILDAVLRLRLGDGRVAWLVSDESYTLLGCYAAEPTDQILGAMSSLNRYMASLGLDDWVDVGPLLGRLTGDGGEGP